jgi:hypothetical protein
MLHCILCGQTGEHEIITHINSAHNGLKAYLEAFPAHVVSEELTATIIYKAPPSEAVSRTLNCLSAQDLALVSKHHALAQPLRSEIIIS